MFRTDIRQIFDFIRCSGDKERLQRLIDQDSAYREVDEGEKRLAALTQILLQRGRIEDLGRAVAQKEYREILYREFEL